MCEADMNEDETILAEVVRQKRTLGIKCKKFSGSITAEVMRSHLREHGFSLSPRDVFIRGVDAELDLLVLAPTARPAYQLLYDPAHVTAVLEIKNHGSFGQQTIDTTRRVFDKVKAVAPGALCLYVTLREREGYKHAVTPENLGYPAFTMFLHKGSAKKAETWRTGQWESFIEQLQQHVSQFGD